MSLFLRVFAGLALLGLIGCGASVDSGPDSSPEAVARAAYQHDGPPAITLYTMINNRSKAGAHSSLMINGSQRVIFDPAGTVRLSAVPERGDVLYGVTPSVADFYARAHARETYHVVIQRIEVSPAVAEQALSFAISNGRVGSARCTVSTSGLLRQLPGFESIRSTWFPKNLMNQVEDLPGVTTTRLSENDDDDKSVAIAKFEMVIDPD